jgi:lambda family phage tail tape measure protein
MAKKIEELVVELGIKGLEGLDNLSSSFRNLQKAIGPSDNAITQVRRSILDMSSAGKQSIQMIQGQIDAFKGLQTQATIGSNIYRQLSGDVNRLSDTLRQLRGDYEEVGRVARQTDAQIANQFPARRPEAFRVQLAALNRELGQLSVSARAYGDALTEITIRETAFGRAQARQGAIAGAQAVGAPLIAAMTPQQALPNTTAALRVQLAELTQDFDNLDRSGEQYAQVAQRISEIQEELSRNILGVATAYDRHAAAENAAIRRAEKIRGIQEYYRGRGAATGFRDPSSGAIIAGGAPGTSQPLPIERPMREISGLFQQIGQIGMQPIISNIEMMGRSYDEVAASIKGATAASNGSISSLQAQRSAWQQLRAQLDPASAGFKQAGREIEQLDRRLERFQQRRRRMGAMEATQAAGAVISGGIFGGPEGAIGGAVGTAVGGVPGAFAGAAIGAQVGMIRQSLGQMAAFTAEIDKQRIALRNVVGTQQEYQNSLQFIDATSRRLAIPQDQLNKQFTQLSASVIGAGGNVDAAKMAFEGIAAGIRGTGGNLADMQSALLATSQVFSKGKVSAEELRQQIGERLPGAFTIFAESIGKTPQELDKMLEKGQVTLNDFMTFVQALSQRYGASANEIAASSQSAGDRMATTFARIREAVGRELQPVGAQFQEVFATAFAENEQAIVDFAKNIATAAKVVADNAGLIAESLKVLLGFGAIAAAIPLAASVAAAFTKVSVAVASMGGAASVAGLAVKGLIASLVAVSPFGWIAAGVVGLGLLGKAVYDNNEIFRNWVDNIGNVVAGDFRNSMDAMAGDAESATNRISGAFEGLGQNMSSVSGFIQQVFDDLFGSVSRSGAASASQVDNSWADAMNNIGANTSAAFNGLTQMLANWWEALPAPLRNILGGNTASMLAGAAQYAAGASGRAARGGAGRATAPLGPDVPQRLQTAAPPRLQFRFPGSDVGAGGGGGKGGKSGADKAADDAAREAARVAEIVRARQLSTLELQRQTVFSEKIAMAEMAKDTVLVRQLQGQQELMRLGVSVAAELEKERNTMAQLGIAREFQAKKALALLDIELDVAKIKQQQTEQFNTIITDLDLELALKTATTEQERERLRLASELARLQGQGFAPEQIEAIATRKTELAAPLTDAQNVEQRIGKLKDEVADLTNIGNIAINVADGIGTAFAQAFQGLISGSMSAKEALSGFFKSVGDMFVEMAAQIIAKQMTMIILQTILKALGAVAGGGGVSDLNAPASINNPLGSLGSIGGAYAKGGTFANGIQPFANGGIVNSPTLFKFANGGAMRTGLMGEAGPEAIMPLKRGADGKLGVQAAGLREAMGSAPGSTAGSPVLNMSFQSTNINGVEYVSRDQLEQAMAQTRRQASRDGAQRGMSMTLDKLQQSPSTRSRVGIR